MIKLICQWWYERQARKQAVRIMVRIREDSLLMYRMGWSTNEIAATIIRRIDEANPFPDNDLLEVYAEMPRIIAWLHPEYHKRSLEANDHGQGQ